MWEALFWYSWKEFEPQFRYILDSLARQKKLRNSGKSKGLVLEAETSHEQAANVDEEQWRLESIIDKINPPNCYADQNAASEQRKASQSGEWILQNEHLRAWRNVNADLNPLLYINGIPGAGTDFKSNSLSESILTMYKGKTVLASFIIETLLKEENSPVLFRHSIHNVME